MKIKKDLKNINVDEDTEVNLRSENNILDIGLNTLESDGLDEILLTINNENVSHDYLKGLENDGHPQYLDTIRHLLAHGGSLEQNTHDNIGDLADITIVNPQVGQVIKYQGHYWVNSNIAHSELEDLDADDHTQYLNNTRHTINTHSYQTNLPHDDFFELENVLISNPLNGQILGISGGKIVNIPNATGIHSRLTGLGADDHKQYILANGTRAFSGDINLTNHLIHEVATPVESADAANKDYVDGILDGTVWRQPVDEMVDYIPPRREVGWRVAISHTADGDYSQYRGYIYELTSQGWIGRASERGTCTYVEDQSEAYLWNGTIWTNIGSSGVLNGVILADGTIPLTSNWGINTEETEIHKTINMVPNPEKPDQVSNKAYVDSKISSLTFGNPVIARDKRVDGTLVTVAYQPNPTIGDRYIASWMLESGVHGTQDIFECTDYIETIPVWIKSNRKRGMVVFVVSEACFVAYNGSEWVYLEEMIDINKINMSSFHLLHSALDAESLLRVEDHPQYLWINGDNHMDNNLNMGSYNRIINMGYAINDHDAVTLSQLNLVANGLNWIPQVDTMAGTPPDSPIPGERIIVTLPTTNSFNGHENEIAVWYAIEEEWQFEVCSKGDACLVADSNRQCVFNGDMWVVLGNPTSHHGLAGIADVMTDDHPHYVHIYFPKTIYSLNVFDTGTSQEHNKPFVVSSYSDIKVDYLNADMIDGYHVGTSGPNTIVVRNAQGAVDLDSTIASLLRVDKIYLPKSLSYDRYGKLSTSQASLSSDGLNAFLTVESNESGGRGSIYLDASNLYFGDDNSDPVIHLSNANLADAGKVNGHSVGTKTGDISLVGHNHKEELRLSDLSDVVETGIPVHNQVIAWDNLRATYTNKDLSTLSALSHSALRNLTYRDDVYGAEYTDDHLQYLNVGRHNVGGIHILGVNVPIPSLSQLGGVQLSNLQENDMLVYRKVVDGQGHEAGSYFYNIQFNGSLITHDSTIGTADSVAHNKFLTLDGTRWMEDAFHFRSYRTPLFMEIGDWESHTWIRDKSIPIMCGSTAGAWVCDYTNEIMIESDNGKAKWKMMFGDVCVGADGKPFEGDPIEDVGVYYTTQLGFRIDAYGTDIDTIFGSSNGYHQFFRATAADHEGNLVGCLEFMENQIWWDGAAKGASNQLVGLNADLLDGLHVQEITAGIAASISHHLIKELHYANDDPHSEVMDDHPQYINSARHNTDSHSYSSNLPHDSIFNLSDTLYPSKVDKYGLVYSSQLGKMVLSDLSDGIDHDTIAGASNSRIHENYLIKNDTDTVTGSVTFSRGTNQTPTVPFIVGQYATSTVQNLNSQMLEGYRAHNFAILAENNAFTENVRNNFYGEVIINNVENPTKAIFAVPEKTHPGTPTKGEIYLHISGGLFYSYDGIHTVQIPVATSLNALSGTTSTTFQIDSDDTGPKLKNVSGALEIRNAADTGYTSIKCSDIIVTGSGSSSSIILAPSNSEMGDILVYDGSYYISLHHPATAGQALLHGGHGTLPYWGSVDYSGNYLGINAKAADSDKLDGNEGSYYSPISGPSFSGIPTAPTAALGTNTTQIATTEFVQSAFGYVDALIYKGIITCADNPNYPTADAGHVYKVSAAGKIGGVSGITVEIGDMLLCNTDSTVAGNQATVGTKWDIIQTNVDTSLYALDSAVVHNTLYDANTILAASNDNIPLAVTVAEQTLLGRITGGYIRALSVSQINTLLNLGTAANKDIPATGNASATQIVYGSDTRLTDARKSLVSANDTTSGYLNGKLVSGTGITLTELTDGGNETLSISCSFTGSQAKISANDTTSGYLNGKLLAGTSITLTEGTDGGNETLTIALTTIDGGGI